MVELGSSLKTMSLCLVSNLRLGDASLLGLQKEA